MTSKTFVTGTVIDSAWLNDVNTATYTTIPALSTGKANAGANNDITSLGALTVPLATAGANTNITSLAGLSTPLSLAQGGTASTSAATARTSLGAAQSGANTDITSLASVTSINGGGIGGLQNLVKNPGFTINQRGYVSAAVLATGVPATGVGYGHDCWRGGAGGGTYSFTQLEGNTQITIAANKTLIQAIEAKDVQHSSYVLTWTGTALGRVGLNGAAPSGAYAASPIIMSGTVASGTQLSIEFGNGASAGTLGTVQLKPGAVAVTTSMESRPYAVELALCQRYLPGFRSSSIIDFLPSAVAIASGTSGTISIPHPVPTRIPTTGAIISASADYTLNAVVGGGVCSAVTFANGGINATRLSLTQTGMTAGQVGQLYANSATAYILLTGAEL